MHKILVIGGDGIGPEVIDATLRVLEAAGLDADYTQDQIGGGVFEEHGVSVRDVTMDSARDSDAILFGATTTPVGLEGYRSAILTMRQGLDLYANVRPARRGGVDMVIVRENTEGLYSQVEQVEEDRAVTSRIITRVGSERIARYAFELARRENRSRVLCVHKANVMPGSDGLFLEEVRKVSKDFGRITLDEGLVDAVAMKMVSNPDQFDVIVTTNMFGDILSDIASQLTGGIGLAASGSYGARTAMFEPVHGSAPDIAGQGIANPIATIRSAVMMLSHLGEIEMARGIEDAVEVTLAGEILTPDLGGSASTHETTTALIGNLED